MSINELRKAALTQMWVIIRDTAKELGIPTRQVSRKDALALAWEQVNPNQEKEIYMTERRTLWLETEKRAMYLNPVMKAAKYLENVYNGTFWTPNINEIKTVRIYRNSTFKCEKTDYFVINLDDFSALVSHFEQGRDFSEASYQPNQGLYLDALKKAKTQYPTWDLFLNKYVGQRIKQAFDYETLKQVFNTEL